MMNKIAITRYPVHQLIKSRWSPRSFLNDKIPEETIFTLFEAASWAPSSRNEQPWRFIYGIKDEGPNYKKIYDTLVHWNQQWAKTAPLLILTVAKLNSEFHNQENKYALYDLGQSVANLVFQAGELNLYCHQMGGFDEEKARNAFQLPIHFSAITVIAVGYLGNPDILPEDMKELETRPRTRMDISRIAFDKEFKL